jgi:hypothetical protein
LKYEFIHQGILAFYKNEKTVLDDAVDFNTSSFRQLVVIFSRISLGALYLFYFLIGFEVYTGDFGILP